jgi:hypothetical protein
MAIQFLHSFPVLKGGELFGALRKNPLPPDLSPGPGERGRARGPFLFVRF